MSEVPGNECEAAFRTARKVGGALTEEQHEQALVDCSVKIGVGERREKCERDRRDEKKREFATWIREGGEK